MNKLQDSTPSAEEVILGTRNSGTILIAKAENALSKETKPSGGRLYTEDMPALEDLLARYEVVTAVIHKPAPTVQVRDPANSKHAQKEGESFSRVLILGGSPAMMLTAGVVMMVGAIAGARSVTNPYLAVALVVMGLTLGATTWTALHEARRDKR